MNKQACQKWIEKRESGDCCVKKRKNEKVSKKNHGIFKQIPNYQERI